jgi:hypothetical protein
MTTTKLKKVLCATIIGIVVSSHQNAYAEEANRKLKSVGVAVALGLDPIPGDALIYAGKRGQAGGDMILGGVGAAALIASALIFNGSNGYGRTGCLEFCVIAYPLLAAGGAIYLGSLLWDGIGGVAGVKSYNEAVQKQQSSIWRRVQPTVAVTNEGLVGGVQFRF